jgi:hypothetical protein
MDKCLKRYKNIKRNKEKMDDAIEEEFDDRWITHYKESETEYNLFYKSEVNNVDLFFYYINEENKSYELTILNILSINFSY